MWILYLFLIIVIGFLVLMAIYSFKDSGLKTGCVFPILAVFIPLGGLILTAWFIAKYDINVYLGAVLAFGVCFGLMYLISLLNKGLNNEYTYTRKEDDQSKAPDEDE